MNTQFRSILLRKRELELSVTGRKSKKELPRPVWFVAREDSILLLPVAGSSTQWYKNLRTNPTLKLKAGSSAFVGEANLLTDKADVQEVVKMFTAKYGDKDMKQYYTILDVAVQLKLK